MNPQWNSVPLTKTNQFPVDISFGFIHRPMNCCMSSINVIWYINKDVHIMCTVPVKELLHQTYRLECMTPCYGSLSATCGWHLYCSVRIQRYHTERRWP